MDHEEPDDPPLNPLTVTAVVLGSMVVVVVLLYLFFFLMYAGTY